MIFRSDFVDWFSGSLVANQNGEPLIVYRGEHGFFDENHLNTFLGSISFSSKNIANIYAINPNRFGARAYHPRIFPAYLSIKNPVIMSPNDQFIGFGKIVEIIGQAKATEIAFECEDNITSINNWIDNFDGIYDCLDAFFRKGNHISSLYMDAFLLFDSPKYVNWFRELGYDGGIHGGAGEGFDETEYKVFEASQVKSVFEAHG